MEACCTLFVACNVILAQSSATPDASLTERAALEDVFVRVVRGRARHVHEAADDGGASGVVLAAEEVVLCGCRAQRQALLGVGRPFQPASLTKDSAQHKRQLQPIDRGSM